MCGFKARKTRCWRWRDKYRWLRSDGKPNFDDRIYRKTEELMIIAKKPVVSVSSSTPIIEALEKMSLGYRSLVVVRGGNIFEGLVVSTDFINYLGGGEYYNIVVNRHGRNIYSALRNEPIATLMNKEPVVAYIDEKFPEVLERMVVSGVGVIPVLTRDNRVYGIITEKDIIDYLASTTSIGVKVSDIMSTPVVTVDAGSPIKVSMEKMIKYGFRRLPVTKGRYIEGIITAMDLVKFFGTHEAFKKTRSGDIEEVLKTPNTEVMVKEIVAVKPGSDAGEAVRIMAEKNVGSVLVVNESNELTGIVTERDILYAIVAPRK